MTVYVVYFHSVIDNDFVIKSVHATEAGAQAEVERLNEARLARYDYEEWEVKDA